jgi:hypothetical protein
MFILTGKRFYYAHKNYRLTINNKAYKQSVINVVSLIIKKHYNGVYKLLSLDDYNVETDTMEALSKKVYCLVTIIDNIENVGRQITIVYYTNRENGSLSIIVDTILDKILIDENEKNDELYYENIKTFTFLTASNSSYEELFEDNVEIKKNASTEQIRKKPLCIGAPPNVDYTNKEACSNAGFVWDKPPENNTDCPFYKSNKNYPNNFGGVNGNGFCVLPLGLVPAGFSSWYPESRPLCYNCKSDFYGKGSLGYCCDKQESPDYAFPGDQETRRKYLQNTNLSYN